jgi:hypothetical protein
MSSNPAGRRRELGHERVRQPHQQQVLETAPPARPVPRGEVVPSEPHELAQRRDRVHGHAGTGVRVGRPARPVQLTGLAARTRVSPM